MYLVKFVALSGLCSRRKSEELIISGLIKVNDVVEKKPNYLVQENDVVCFQNKVLKPLEKKLYFVMNKPIKVMTTLFDPQGRRTIVDVLAQNKITDKLFPVGRLDYMTSGLLILTNDGELAYKLSHPKFKVSKKYEVILNRNFNDLQELRQGIKLHDGFIKPDAIEGFSQNNKKVLITLHSGKNRIVRRIFEYFNYKVNQLNRIKVGSLSLGKLPVGKVEKITKQDVSILTK